MDVSFPTLKDFGVLKNILLHCKDNERIFFSHTSKSVRQVVVNWIPTLKCYRTLTPPRHLPDLFDKKNGVYVIEYPHDQLDFNFKIAMLGQCDLFHNGVKALKWFRVASGLTPALETSRLIMTTFLMKSKSLSDKQLLVLKQRFRSNMDECLFVPNMEHWGLIRNLMEMNESINRFVLFSKSEVTCYAEVFNFLSQRENKTEYIDISGNLTQATIESFYLVARDLTGVMLRDLSSPTMLHLLDTILVNTHEERLTSLQFDSVLIESSVQDIVIEVLQTFDIAKILFSKVSIAERGFTRFLSVLCDTSLKKLHFRKCELSACETIQCLFLPTMKDSRLKELVLTGVKIPEVAAEALASCVEAHNFLHTLDLEGTKLGPECVRLLVKALRKSSLSTLNLKGNDIGELGHKLFRNIGTCGTLRELVIDACHFCRRSMKDYKWAKARYDESSLDLHVSVFGCKFGSCTLV